MHILYIFICYMYIYIYCIYWGGILHIYVFCILYIMQYCIYIIGIRFTTLFPHCLPHLSMWPPVHQSANYGKSIMIECRHSMVYNGLWSLTLALTPVICLIVQPYPVQRPSANATSGTNHFAGGSIESSSENQWELECFRTLDGNMSINTVYLTSSIIPTFQHYIQSWW